MKGKRLDNVWRVMLILFAVMNAGIFMALRTATLVNPWVVTIVAIIISFPISILCANKATRLITFRRIPLRVIAWMFLIAPIFTGAFYGLNFQFADRKNVATERAIVDRKYYKTRRHTRRVGRGRYVPTGEPYNVYYADIRLGNGHIVTVSLDNRHVPRVRKGQSVYVNVAGGAFGLPVVITRNIFDK